MFVFKKYNKKCKITSLTLTWPLYVSYQIFLLVSLRKLFLSDTSFNWSMVLNFSEISSSVSYSMLLIRSYCVYTFSVVLPSILVPFTLPILHQSCHFIDSPYKSHISCSSLINDEELFVICHESGLKLCPESSKLQNNARNNVALFC